MKTIKYQNNVISFDKIIGFGCSYTAGTELVDHSVLNISAEKSDELKRKMPIADYYGEISSKFAIGGLSSVFDLQKKYAYIAHLAKKFEVPWENYAYGGSSLEYVCWLLTKKIYNKEIRDTDLIVIGVTCPNRAFYVKNKEEVMHLQLSRNVRWPNDEFFEDYLMTFGNEDTTIWKYFHQLQYLSSLNEKLNNRIVLLPMSFPCHEWVKILFNRRDQDRKKEEQYYIDELKSIRGMMTDDLEPLMLGAFENQTVGRTIAPEDLHGYGHCNMKIHEQYAERLYKKLTGES